MATLVITKSYADGDVLLESDLDNIKDDIETFLNTTGVNDDNIADGGVGTSSIADSAVTTAKINNSAVTTAKINDLAVTQGKIALLAVDNAQMAVGAAIANVGALGVLTANINTSAVTTAKILDANVTTAKIADAAVTPAKRSTALGGSGNTTSTTGITTSSSIPVTFTGTGRPVFVSVNVSSAASSTNIPGFVTHRTVKIYKNGSAICTLYTTPDNLTDVIVPASTFLDTTGYSGSVTYDLRTDGGTCGPASGDTLYLSAFEL
jgi:hypothetical protein